MSAYDMVFMDHAVIAGTMAGITSFHNDRFSLPEYLQKIPVIIRTNRTGPSGFIPLHWHPGLEVVYSESQTLSVTIDGCRMNIRPGESVLIGPYVLHVVTFCPRDGPPDILTVTFQEDYLRQVWPHLQEVEIGRDASGAMDGAKRRLSALCAQLYNQVAYTPESAEQHFQTNQILFAMLQAIYYDFVKEVQVGLGKRKEMRHGMLEILEYMREHYQENLTTQSVADRFDYTREYFCRLFKRYSNETFKSYLTALRLSATVREMQTSNRSAAEIATSQGFPDKKGFFAAFKKEYGVTPAQWRAEQQKGQTLV